MGISYENAVRRMNERPAQRRPLVVARHGGPLNPWLRRVARIALAACCGLAGVSAVPFHAAAAFEFQAVGARSGGLGDTFVGWAAGVDGVFWNAGAVAWGEGISFTGGYERPFGMAVLDAHAIGAVASTGKAAVGVGYQEYGVQPVSGADSRGYIWPSGRIPAGSRAENSTHAFVNRGWCETCVDGIRPGREDSTQAKRDTGTCGLECRRAVGGRAGTGWYGGYRVGARDGSCPARGRPKRGEQAYRVQRWPGVPARPQRDVATGRRGPARAFVDGFGREPGCVSDRLRDAFPHGVGAVTPGLPDAWALKGV